MMMPLIQESIRVSFDGGMGGSDEGDPLFEEAKALVIETQKASAR